MSIVLRRIRHAFDMCYNVSDTDNEKLVLAQNKQRIESILQKIEQEYKLKISDKTPKEGSYGYIYFAVHAEKTYVIKIFKEVINNVDVMNEISCLAALSKYDCFPKPYYLVEENKGKYVAIIMSYCGRILKPETIVRHNRVILVLQFLKIYHILDQEQIVHCDIKNDNVCIDTEGQLSIIDFGYARRAPFIFTDLFLIYLNRHVEFLNTHYHPEYNDKIDLMSIFNMLAFIFNVSSETTSFCVYPIDIESEASQLKNIVYLLLVNHNNCEKRERIYHMLKKITHFDVSLENFHKTFEEKESNRRIYQAYRNIIGRIPTPLYRVMKKLLNINPRARISYREFFQKVSKIYPLFLYSAEKYEMPILHFDKIVWCTDQKNYAKYLVKFSRERCPSRVCAITYYNFFQARGYFKSSVHNSLWNHILYINYTTLYYHVYPPQLHFVFQTRLFIQYLDLVRGDLHQKNPYNHLHQMKLFKWKGAHHNLFDKLLMIASTHPVFMMLLPLSLCVILTLFIYYYYRKLPIIPDYRNEYVHLPTILTLSFILDNNTLHIFLSDKKFMLLFNNLCTYVLRCRFSKLILGVHHRDIVRNVTRNQKEPHKIV